MAKEASKEWYAVKKKNPPMKALFMVQTKEDGRSHSNKKMRKQAEKATNEKSQVTKQKLLNGRDTNQSINQGSRAAADAHTNQHSEANGLKSL